MRAALFLAALALGASCAPAPTTTTTPARSPAPAPTDTCAARGDGRIVCDSDRMCPGGACVRVHADDACGVCGSFFCSRDVECAGAFGDLGPAVCDTVRARCERADACDILDATGATRRGGGGERDDGAGTSCDGGRVCAPHTTTTTTTPGPEDDPDEELADFGAQCVAPDPVACEIVPAAVVTTTTAAALPAEALFLDGEGRPDPSSAPVALVEGEARAEIVRLATAPGLPPTRVACAAPVVVLGEVPAGFARVVVRDVETGAVLAGARVDIDVDGDGLVDDSGIADGSGAFLGVADVAPVRVTASSAGHVTTSIVKPGAYDVELLLAPASSSGDVNGVAYGTRLDLRPGRAGDVGIAIGSLSAGNLVDGLTADTLYGVRVSSTAVVGGLIGDDGVSQDRPSAAQVTLGTDEGPMFQGASVALSAAPGKRLLSMAATSITFSEFAVAFAPENRSRPFAMLVQLWQNGDSTTSFGLAGGVATLAAAAPANDDEMLAFANDPENPELPELAPALDASDEIDVDVPRLLVNDDAAFVAVYALVPGRGAVLLALRFVNDLDADGLVDTTTHAGAPAPAGRARMYVAPSLWLAGRPLLVVAGSSRFDRLQEGDLPLERVASLVADHRVALPPFVSPTTSAVVEGARVIVPPRGHELVLVDGKRQGRAQRVYFGPTATDADTGLDSVDRVTSVGGDDVVTFATGSLDVQKRLARPAVVHALFAR